MASRIMSSFSYWIELVLILIFAQYVLKLSGKRTDHNTVKFGSGAGPSHVMSVRNGMSFS